MAAHHRTGSHNHLELPKSSAPANNRLSLDSALLRKNPFARANASSLQISTEAANSDSGSDCGLKSAPPVPDSKRNSSSSFLLADRLLHPFSSSASSTASESPVIPPPPAGPLGGGCEMSEEEMQGLLEHVRRAENDRVRAEHELARREKELARVKNELRRAEGDNEELRERLRAAEQRVRALEGTLRPGDLGVLPPGTPPAVRHDSLEPMAGTGEEKGSVAGSGSPVLGSGGDVGQGLGGQSPYYVSGGGSSAAPGGHQQNGSVASEGYYYASTSSMELVSPTTNALAHAASASQHSLRPLSCSAAIPQLAAYPNGGNNASSPRLSNRPSMASISELYPPPPMTALSSSSHVGGAGDALGIFAAGMPGEEQQMDDGEEGGVSPKHRRHFLGRSKAPKEPKEPKEKKQIKERKSSGRLKEKFSRLSMIGR
ncbi:hypothetical protein MPH_02198 [Macrophomina phaseolina MS6]|uniref:Uncharacterized protein n=1 Tax=Macrophomina phaseolina (strain MS6) TaxID=1126212 RepID=K2SV11_MACPH|nr:hypothetical protein MPH_02198 [Macrophomina phaseolina MS6]